MFKRIIALSIALIITSAVFFTHGDAFFATSRNPFAFFDEQRELLLKGNSNVALTKPLKQPETGENYIVTFDSSKELAAKALSGYSYRPLAYSDRLVFLVNLENPDEFFNKNKHIISGFDGDFTRTTFNNESEKWEISAINATDLDYNAIGSASHIKVALIDSGIKRDHPFFDGANILDGFDVTSDHQKVTDDASGHGTKIAGIVVSLTGKTKRSSASIIPIKVSENGKDIKTSDLIDAIYLAADSGANVINMSFGGYEFVKAEEDAINYASTKGCIMVAASGNEGSNREYEGRYSYPASYDNVISVSAIGQNGTVCGFSQYNDKVDIAAPGESICLLGDTNENFVYDNGTSYSAAFVTASAVLANAYAKKMFNSTSFERLLEYSCFEQKKDIYLGFGALNISSLLENATLPIVYGVNNGGTYFDRVNIYYDGDSATLDGEDFGHGGDVYSHGSHTLIVKNAIGERTVNFMLDTIPLKYNYNDFGTHCDFTFSVGNGYIDGIPYASGTKFDLIGTHTFTLNGPSGNSVSKEFSVSGGIPSYQGVQNSAVYNHSVLITVSNGGITTLNGVEFTDSIFVSENGTYVLELSDSKKLNKQTVRFSINRLHDMLDIGSFENPKLYVDESLEISAVYSQLSGTVTLIKNTELTSLEFNSPIISVYTKDTMLYVLNTKGLDIIDLSAESCQISNIFISDSAIDNGIFSGNQIIYTDVSGHIQTASLDGVKGTRINLGVSDVTFFAESNRGILIYSNASKFKLYIFKPENSELTSVDIPPYYGEPIYADGNTVYCNFGAFDINTLLCKVQYSQTDAVTVKDGYIITSKQVIKSDGSILGLYAKEASDWYFGTENNYILYQNGSLCIIPAVSASTDINSLLDTVPYRESARNTPYKFSPFESVVSVSGRTVLDIQAVGGKLYAIFENDNALYAYDSKTLSLTSKVFLKFFPVALKTDGNALAVLFHNTNCIWQEGVGYITAPSVISDIALSKNGIFALVNNKVYKISQSSVKSVNLPETLYIDKIVANSKYLYVSSAFDITSFDISTFEFVASTDSVMSNYFDIIGGYLVSGRYILDAETLQTVNVCNSIPYSIVDNFAITTRGVFEIGEGAFASNLYAGLTDATVDSDCNTYIAYGDTIRRIDYWGTPENNESLYIYQNSKLKVGDIISSSGGLLYYDGILCENEFALFETGNHLIEKIYPWNIKEGISVNVTTDPLSVELEISRKTLSPGETARVSATLLPIGAEGNISYRVEGDSVTLTDGVITAVSVGQSTIIATVDGTEIIASQVINVTDDTIICTNPDLKYNSFYSCVSRVPSGTTEEQLLSNFYSKTGTFKLVTPSGQIRKDGLVSSGCKIVCYSGDTVIETITVSVEGDLDGDGFVTVNDADILYSSLRSTTVFTHWQTESADINDNGIITSADLKLLSDLIGRLPHSDVKVGSNIKIEAPDYISGSGTFMVSITVDESQTTSLMATLEYDSDVLEYISSSYNEGSVSVDASNGLIFFTALDVESLPENRILNIYFKIKDSSPKSTVLTLKNGEAYISDLFALNPVYKEITVKEESKSFSITSSNSNLQFLSSVSTYSVAVLDGEDSLELDFELPSGAMVYLPSLKLTNGTTLFEIKYVSPSGKTQSYYISATPSSSLPKNDSPALLKYLTVIGFELNKEFDPNEFLYTVQIDPYVTELRFDYDPVFDTTVVTLLSPDKINYGSNIFTINCTAENGEKATYTVIAEKSTPQTDSSLPPSSNASLPEQTAPSDVSSDSDGGISTLTAAALLCGVIILCTLAIIFVRKRK